MHVTVLSLNFAEDTISWKYFSFTLSHSPLTPSLLETPRRLKSSAIMTSFFAYQKSSSKCQQFTTVKFKNVFKHNKITPCSFYTTIIAWNQLTLFHGCTKITIFLTCGPIRWFTVVSHIKRGQDETFHMLFIFYKGFLIHFFQSAIAFMHYTWW